MYSIDEEYLRKLHEYLAEELFKGKPYFIYERYRFQLKDYEYASPVDMREFRRMGIISPPELEFTVGSRWTLYEVFRNSDIKSYGRLVACSKLARLFVYEMLPEIDRRIRILINNEEIEKVLSVLD